MPLDTSPLVVLVNPGSGGKQGSKIIERFKKYVPAENIFDLSQGGPTPGLMKYRGSRFRIIACGGDGTVGWIVSEIDKLKLPVELTPPIAILPLGTGNDLSRVLKWGPSYTGKGLKSFMSQVEKACVVMMDKWRVTCETQGHGNDTPASNYIMNNYFSVGADADVALQFHEMRTAHPAKFTSRTQNMLLYARIGVANLSPEPLGDNVKVEVDGCEVVFPENTRAVVVLNLPSYAGGGNPWGSRKSKHKKGTFVSPAIDDGLLEVVAISGPVQLVAIHANIGKGKKLAQGRDIKVTITKPMACQVDGEPWRQQASVITIQHGGPSPVLANSKPTVPFAATQSSLNLTREVSASPLSSSPSPSPSSNPRVLLRTRSSSSPVENTPSPIKYGPIQPEKRKKGRVYCDECGLEFYLPYMLTNHLASGLCCSSSSSGPAPKKSDSRTTISMKVTDDGASPGVQLEGEEEEKEREERERREGVWRRHSAEVSYLNNKNNESEYNNGEYIDDEEEEEEEGEEKDGSSSSPRKHPPSRHNGTIEIAAE